MAKRKQKIAVVLYTPSEMGIERQRRIEEFWIEKMMVLIKKYNLNKQEQQYLAEELNVKLVQQEILYKSINT